MSDKPKKKPYQPPTLTCYGLVVNLTTGGSGKMAEMVGKTDDVTLFG